MKHIISIFFLVLSAVGLCNAQNASLLGSVPQDTLISLLQRPYVAVDNKICVLGVDGVEGDIVLRLSSSAEQLPLTVDDVRQISDSLRHWCGKPRAKVEIKADDVDLVESAFDAEAWCDNDPSGSPVVSLDRRMRGPLTGRNIAVAASHGRYFERSLKRWEWQRGRLFTTVEDLLTPSYVIPFLLPMLENAGAMVFTPRERDTTAVACIVDNDAADSSFIAGGSFDKSVPGWGRYTTLSGNANPFALGTASFYSQRRADSIYFKGKTEVSGPMMVYLSYASDSKSSRRVKVTVRHAGGESHFLVNQQQGGGMWIPLGIMPFEAGKEWTVVLHSRSRGLVSADAVRIGGGMGTVERGGTVSGMPAWAEGARYNLQAGGFDYPSVVSFSGGKNDYNDDINCRGEWVNTLVNKKGITIDAMINLHTDAGVTGSDSVIGSLAIVSIRTGKKNKLPNGRNPLASRLLASHVEHTVVNDIRRSWDADWTTRGIVDKSYAESRSPQVPAFIFEMLSHQNIADVSKALHPAFRHDMCRAIYKGLLRYLAGPKAAVSPLAPSAFGITFADGAAAGSLRLSWRATADTLEPTAVAESFLVYDGDRLLCSTDQNSIVIAPADTLIHTYHVVALGRGGRSMPSASLSACVRHGGARALLVKGMDRLSAPTIVSGPQLTGVMATDDEGVAWHGDRYTCGDQHDFDASHEWQDDDAPGCGASYADRELLSVCGTGCSQPTEVEHLMLENGYSFVSQSKDYFDNSSLTKHDASEFSLVRIELDRQRTSAYGDMPSRHAIYTEGFMNNTTTLVNSGVRLIISGSFVGTDIAGCDKVRSWCSQTLGFRPRTAHASRTYRLTADPQWLRDNMLAAPRPESVWHLNVDAIEPSDAKGSTVLRYVDSQMSAGVERRNVLVVGF